MSSNSPPLGLRRSLAWVGFGQASYFMLNFLGSVAIARLLSPYDTGVFAIASATVGVLAIIQAMGLNNFLIRETRLTPDLIASVDTANAATSLLLAALVATMAIAGGVYFGDPGVRRVLLVMALVPLIGHFAFLPNAMMEREGRFRTLALIRTGSTAAGLILTISFALAGFRYMSLAYSQVLTAAGTNVTIMIIARHHLSFRFSITHWRQVSRFGAQIFAISGVSGIARRLSDVVLGRFLGLAALGLYSRASSNYNIIWDNIHITATRVLFIDFVALIRDGVPLRDRYLQVVTMITAVLWPAFLGTAVLAGPLISIIYGARWVGAATPLSLLCLAGVLLTSITMTGELFVVSGETGRQARLEAIRTIVGLVLFVVGCLHSLAAAAAARVADAAFTQILYRPHVARLAGVGSAELWQIYRSSTLLTIAAVMPATTLMAAWHWSPTVPAWQVCASIVGGGVAWLAAIYWLGHPLREEARRLLARAHQRSFSHAS